MRIVLPLFLAVIFFSGCAASGGDMVVRVSGKLPVAVVLTEAPDICQLSMIGMKNGRVISSRQVSGSFSTTMMVVAVPRPERYYFTA